MKLRRELVLWAAGAGLALVLLAVILNRQTDVVQRRWATQVSPRPAEGTALFRSKGCAACHSAGAGASGSASPLRQLPSDSSLPRLVTAMWNHAPRMWESMRARRLPYPELSYEEAGQLVAYLYLHGYADGAGDPERGKQLFGTKHCARCHSVGGEGGHTAPDLSALSVSQTPILWTQVLWNHASSMQARMQKLGLSWPKFQENELLDLFAYIRQSAPPAPARDDDGNGDPDRGWKVFQAKGCGSCHGLTREQGHIGPEFGPNHDLPPSYAQFGAAMLNHFPEMQRAMSAQQAAPPVFQAQEMLDLAVFLYSLHYLEPSGSPQIGSSVFSWRGCSQCHGAQAEGGRSGPALRGRGQTYTAVRLAADLWRHGAIMYEKSQAAGQPWPTLEERDIGDLLSFLNTPLEKR